MLMRNVVPEGISPGRKPLLAAFTVFVLALGVALPMLGRWPGGTSVTPALPHNFDVGNLPLLFEPNAGQTDPAVRYVAHVPGGTHFFTLSGVVLTLKQPNSGDDTMSAESTYSVLRMNFLGASPNTVINSGNLAQTTVNYFQGSDAANWRANLPTYSGITYANLYAGVDLQYEGDSSRLKGTYTVAPNADPSQIRWRYDGARNVTLDEQGNLQIALASAGENATVAELAPVAWQDIAGQRVPVEARYAVAADGAISFVLGSYDASHPLIIDPALTYSTYLGGGFAEYSNGIAVDDEGNFYVAGFTNSSNFPIWNALQTTLRGYDDSFIVKFNAVGTVIYATFLGGNSFDEAIDIAVDNDGNAYITGITASTNYPAASTGFQTTLGGSYDGFVTKINPTGSAIVFSSYIGGSGDDNWRGSGRWTGAVAVDAQQNVYLAGYTNSEDFPVVNALYPVAPNNANGFVAKVNAAGNTLAWSTYLGGERFDYAFGIDLSSTGNVYVTGSSTSQDFPTLNAYQPFLAASADATLTKINNAGTAILFSTYIGGNREDTAVDVAVDPAGNAYITGSTDSDTYPVTAGVFQPYFASGFYFDPDGFVSKFNSNGTIGYSSYLGGYTGDQARGIDVNANGEAYVMGWTNSDDFPVQGSLYPRRSDDAFVTRVNATASALIFSTFFGGSGRELEGDGDIAVDDIGNIYIAGNTWSDDLPTVNPYQRFRASPIDGFVSRISEHTQTPTPTPTGTISPTPTVCPVGNYSVTATYDEPMVHGTTFVGNSSFYICTAGVDFPFPVNFYGQVFTEARVSSSGSLQFVSNNALPYNYCLPDPENNFAIFGYWDDIHTNVSGIYTSVTGIAPNRVFNIEWYALASQPKKESVNFTIRLFEDLSGRVEIVYGDMAVTGEYATVGVQYGTGGRYTQWSCNQGQSIAPGMKLTFTQPPCGQGTPTTVPATSTPGGPTSTATRPATGTPQATQPVPTGTPGACNVQFSDVPPGSTFYDFVQCLACRGIINGYPDGTFLPGNPVTRGQLSKIVANSAGFTEPVTGQTFEDVTPGSTFYEFIERLASRGYIGGYPCGSPGEPCVGPGDRPYFRPGASVTRGQTAKIVAQAAEMAPPPAGSQTFEDVPQGSTFYVWIERMGLDGIIAGYPCGGPGEPCGNGSRPYFRPGDTVTRGQASKIVSNSFFPECQPGAR